MTSRYHTAPMRKDLGVRPVIFPEPVLIIGTYNADGTPNAMNAAWGGIHEDTEISICIDPGHRTAENIKARKAFTVAFGTLETAKGCDYVGVVSGNNVPDKFARAGFHAERSDKVDAPIIKELPVRLECTLKSYTDSNCECIGEIVNLSIDESIMTDGSVDMGKYHPLVFNGMSREYHVFGEKVGKAYGIGMELK